MMLVSKKLTVKAAAKFVERGGLAEVEARRHNHKHDQRLFVVQRLLGLPG